MNNISTETLKRLEFDKIQELLKSYCYSSLGKDFTDKLKILNNLFEIRYELNIVKDIKDFLLADNDFSFEGLTDISGHINKIKVPGSILQPEIYLTILHFLRTSRLVKSQINSFSNAESDIRKLSDEIYIDKLLEHNIESVIDSSGNVKDTASRNLKKIRESLIDKREYLRKQLSRILKKVTEQELIQDDIITLRDGRSVIPVKVENKRKVSGIIHSSSATGYTVFIEPAETIELNNEITELLDEERREIEKILRYLSEEIAKHSGNIFINLDVLAHLEFSRAKAKFAIDFDCSEPLIKHEGQYNLSKAYHPILLHKFNKSEIVPLDFNPDKNINTIIITGPNAGGKTVALKTIGLLQAMLQAGMQIPASADSEFKVFENIFVVIGDEQSIENSLSSFGSHLKDLNNVIMNSNDKSLILIDEICNGTDPNFGSALAISILKELSERNALTIVTTHIGGLKIYAHNEKRFENASLEYDFERLAPSFKFLLGVPGQSFTFELAKKFNIPDKIINGAKHHIIQDEHQLEDLLKNLSDSKISYEQKFISYDKLNTELQTKVTEYNNRLGNIKQTEKQILKEANIKAKAILEDANKLIEKTVKQVREKEKSTAEIKSDFKESVKKIIPDEKKENIEKEVILKGDYVLVKESNTEGIVIDVNDNNLMINSNGLIIKTKIFAVKKIKNLLENINSDYKINLKEPFNQTLDLRGKYTNEINDILENFIYEGHINSVEELTIIHGKGTGKLRSTVHNFLKKNKYVSEFRLGNWNEGDAGATIISLK